MGRASGFYDVRHDVYEASNARHGGELISKIKLPSRSYSCHLKRFRPQFCVMQVHDTACLPTNSPSRQFRSAPNYPMMERKDKPFLGIFSSKNQTLLFFYYFYSLFLPIADIDRFLNHHYRYLFIVKKKMIRYEICCQ